MKKLGFLVILIILVAPMLIAAKQPQVRLEVINQTEQDIYIQMEYPYTNLKVPPSVRESSSRQREADRDWTRTVFTIQRDVYEDVRIYACGGVFTGKLDLERRLLLNFVRCEEMIQDWSPRWWGEPSLEKPNLYQGPTSDKWQFQYLWKANTP
jgi:hypothetical protein